MPALQSGKHGLGTVIIEKAVQAFRLLYQILKLPETDPGPLLVDGSTMERAGDERYSSVHLKFLARRINSWKLRFPLRTMADAMIGWETSRTLRDVVQPLAGAVQLGQDIGIPGHDRRGMRWPIFAVLGLVAEALSVSNHLVNGFGGASGIYALRTEGD